MTEALQHSLDLLKDTYNYNHWIFSLLRTFLGKDVVEVGSGTGNITRFLLSCERVTCLEPEPSRAQQLQELGKKHLNLRIIESSLEAFGRDNLSTDGVDTVVCLNVLEHIDDDESAVGKMLGLLRPGGSLLLYVPACPWSFGAMDKAMGHHRRYTRSAIKALARTANARVVVSRYVNFPGLIGWWWAGVVLREGRIDLKKARLMDRFVPYVSALERLIRPPVGQSLFAVLQAEGLPSERRENTT